MSEINEYPKWVAPHESQLQRKEVDGHPPHVSSPFWSDVHVARDGAVTVLVEDSAQEAKAKEDVAPKAEAEAEAEPEAKTELADESISAGHD